jgi:hypothetical protein
LESKEVIDLPDESLMVEILRISNETNQEVQRNSAKLEVLSVGFNVFKEEISERIASVESRVFKIEQNLGFKEEVKKIKNKFWQWIISVIKNPLTTIITLLITLLINGWWVKHTEEIKKTLEVKP